MGDALTKKRVFSLPFKVLFLFIFSKSKLLSTLQPYICARQDAEQFIGDWIKTAASPSKSMCPIMKRPERLLY